MPESEIAKRPNTWQKPWAEWELDPVCVLKRQLQQEVREMRRTVAGKDPTPRRSPRVKSPPPASASPRKRQHQEPLQRKPQQVQQHRHPSPRCENAGSNSNASILQFPLPLRSSVGSSPTRAASAEVRKDAAEAARTNNTNGNRWLRIDVSDTQPAHESLYATLDISQGTIMKSDGYLSPERQHTAVMPAVAAMPFVLQDHVSKLTPDTLGEAKAVWVSGFNKMLRRWRASTRRAELNICLLAWRSVCPQARAAPLVDASLLGVHCSQREVLLKCFCSWRCHGMARAKAASETKSEGSNHVEILEELRKLQALCDAKDAQILSLKQQELMLLARQDDVPRIPEVRQEPAHSLQVTCRQGGEVVDDLPHLSEARLDQAPPVVEFVHQVHAIQAQDSKRGQDERQGVQLARTPSRDESNMVIPCNLFGADASSSSRTISPNAPCYRSDVTLPHTSDSPRVESNLAHWTRTAADPRTAADISSARQAVANQQQPGSPLSLYSPLTVRSPRSVSSPRPHPAGEATIVMRHTSQGRLSTEVQPEHSRQPHSRGSMEVQPELSLREGQSHLVVNQVPLARLAAAPQRGSHHLSAVPSSSEGARMPRASAPAGSYATETYRARSTPSGSTEVPIFVTGVDSLSQASPQTWVNTKLTRLEERLAAAQEQLAKVRGYTVVSDETDRGIGQDANAGVGNLMARRVVVPSRQEVIPSPVSTARSSLTPRHAMTPTIAAVVASAPGGMVQRSQSLPPAPLGAHQTQPLPADRVRTCVASSASQIPALLVSREQGSRARSLTPHTPQSNNAFAMGRRMTPPGAMAPPAVMTEPLHAPHPVASVRASSASACACAPRRIAPIASVAAPQLGFARGDVAHGTFQQNHHHAQAGALNMSSLAAREFDRAGHGHAVNAQHAPKFSNLPQHAHIRRPPVGSGA